MPITGGAIQLANLPTSTTRPIKLPENMNMEPIPLEVTAVCIGVLMIVTGVTDVKGAWAPYMHPVVIFIMCCLVFAIAMEKAGLTQRLGQCRLHHPGVKVDRAAWREGHHQPNGFVGIGRLGLTKS